MKVLSPLPARLKKSSWTRLRERNRALTFAHCNALTKLAINAAAMMKLDEVSDALARERVGLPKDMRPEQARNFRKTAEIYAPSTIVEISLSTPSRRTAAISSGSYLRAGTNQIS